AERMLVIFPFEEAVYREAGVPVEFVGHPLVDSVRAPADPRGVLQEIGLDPDRPLVALLPGSRPKEIALNLPPLLATVERLRRENPELRFAVAVAPSLEPGALERAFAGSGARLVQGRTPALLGSATLSLVASGTATVEAALVGAPMVVFYRVSP